MKIIITEEFATSLICCIKYNRTIFKLGMIIQKLFGTVVIDNENRVGIAFTNTGITFFPERISYLGIYMTYNNKSKRNFLIIRQGTIVYGI